MQEQRINKYNKYIVAEDFILVTNYNTVMELPLFLRAVIDTTSKEYLTEKRQSIKALAACFLLSGQKGIPTRARKSIASFKLREGALLGCQTTLRKKKLYTIIDKFLVFALPRLYYEKESEAYLGRTSLLSLSKDSKTDLYWPNTAGRQRLHGYACTAAPCTQQLCKHPLRLRTQRHGVLGEPVQRERSATQSMADYYKNILEDENKTFKGQKRYIMFGIKNLPLIPELQEFLPLFDSLCGVNLGVSFSNPKIKRTHAQRADDTAAVLHRYAYNAARALPADAPLANTAPLCKHGKTCLHSGAVLASDDITYDRTCRHGDRLCMPGVNISMRDAKRKHNQAKSTFTEKGKVEKDRAQNSLYIPSETFMTEENRKILFLTCFQYPRQYN